MNIFVIIPVYNAEKYLQQAVDSVLNQPFKNIQIVLVNDGSIDGSALLCNQIAEKEERVSVIHQENQGAAIARNSGIEYVLEIGKDNIYISFLDADDLWVENVFSDTLVDVIEKQNSDIVGFSTYCSNSTASRFYISNQYEENLILKEKYNCNSIWLGGTFAAHLYNIELFKKNNFLFAEKSTHNEDVIFSVKAAFCAKSIFLINDFLYIYRKNYTSVTNTTKYTLKNANEIPDAWSDAKEFADMCSDINETSKTNWIKVCDNVSSARCLEFIKILAEQGYSFEEISKCFENKEYFYNLDDMDVEDIAAWQKQDLIDYKHNKKEFCDSLKRNSIKTKLINILKSKYFSFITEKIRYNLSLQDI